MDKKPYNIVVDKQNKNVTITMEGMIDPVYFEAYKTELEGIARGLACSEFTLLLDASSFPVQSQEAVGLIKGVFGFYQALKFKEILVKKGDNPIRSMQITRIINQLNMSNVKVVL